MKNKFLIVMIILVIIIYLLYRLHKQEKFNSSYDVSGYDVSGYDVSNIVSEIENEIKTEFNNTNCSTTAKELTNYLGCFSQDNINNCTFSDCTKLNNIDNSISKQCLNDNIINNLDNLNKFLRHYKCYTPTQKSDYLTCIKQSNIIHNLQTFGKNYNDYIINNNIEKNNNYSVVQELQNFIDNFVTCESNSWQNLLDGNVAKDYKSCISNVKCDEDCMKLKYNLELDNTLRDYINNLNYAFNTAHNCIPLNFTS